VGLSADTGGATKLNMPGPSTTTPRASAPEDAEASVEVEPKEPRDLSYILKSAPHQTLEPQITKHVKWVVDKKIFPYEKFFMREAVASGPLILAFIKLVVFCSRFVTNPLLLSTVSQNWQTWRYRAKVRPVASWVEFAKANF